MATEYTYTPEKFFELVKAYHAKTETSQLTFPDLAGLKNALGIEDEEYDAMCEDPAYHKSILWAQRRRESYLLRAATTAKNTTGIKMLLSQPENGGYVEKPVDKTPRQIFVVLRGMDDDDTDNDDSSDICDSMDSDADSGSENTGKGKQKRRSAGSSGGGTGGTQEKA